MKCSQNAKNGKGVAKNFMALFSYFASFLFALCVSHHFGAKGAILVKRQKDFMVYFFTDMKIE